MSRRSSLLVAALLAIPAAALGHGVSPHVEGVEAAIDARLAVLPAEDPAAVALAKAARALAKPSNAKSFAAEIGGVAKAEVAVLTGAPGETDVLAAITTARDAYRGDLVTAHTNVVAALTAQGLKKRVAKKLTRTADALTTLPDALKDLAKSARKAKGWTPYDSGASYTFVVSALALAPEGQGYDLDGDGEPDNGIAGIRTSIELLAGQSLDEILAASLAAGGTSLLLEVFHAGPLQKDRLAFAGFVAGIDSDADPSDNFSGSETFHVDPALLAADGHPAVRAATKIKKGAFRARIDGAALPVGGGAAGLVVVGGTVTSTASGGRIGAAIPTATLLDSLAAAGITIPAILIPTFNAAADYDLDGDGMDDAFSIALDYEAVPATFVATP